MASVCNSKYYVIKSMFQVNQKLNELVNEEREVAHIEMEEFLVMDESGE